MRVRGLTADAVVREPYADGVDVVREVMLVQLFDPRSPIAPGADLMMWSRLGAAYRPGDLRDAVDEQRLLQLASPRVPEDSAAVRAEMAVRLDVEVVSD